MTKPGASKRKLKASPAEPPTVHVKGFGHLKSEAEAKARISQHAGVTNAMSAKRWGQELFGELDGSESVAAMSEAIERVKTGDMGDAEAMLAAQAIVLNQIFNALAQRAHLNVGHYPQTVETYMRMALKAQSQCRTTLETLAEIKNPRPVAFIKQANVSNGPQQVNNGSPAPARAGSENLPNKLLEQSNDERMDTRAAQAASLTNSELEFLPLGQPVDSGKGDV